jgi:hypothetical protein
VEDPQSSVHELHADDLERHAILVVAEEEQCFVGSVRRSGGPDEVQTGMDYDITYLGTGHPMLAGSGGPGEAFVLHAYDYVGQNWSLSTGRVILLAFLCW